MSKYRYGNKHKNQPEPPKEPQKIELPGTFKGPWTEGEQNAFICGYMRAKYGKNLGGGIHINKDEARAAGHGRILGLTPRTKTYPLICYWRTEKTLADMLKMKEDNGREN